MNKLAIFWMEQVAVHGNATAREIIEENPNTMGWTELLKDTRWGKRMHQFERCKAKVVTSKSKTEN